MTVSVPFPTVRECRIGGARAKLATLSHRNNRCGVPFTQRFRSPYNADRCHLWLGSLVPVLTFARLSVAVIVSNVAETPAAERGNGVAWRKKRQSHKQ